MPGDAKTTHLCGCTALLTVFLALAMAPCLADLIPQPPARGSSLASQAGNIRDEVLAGWLRSALVRDGQANVREAAFLFNACYGGGMLDDIDAAMGQTVPWTGGAASRHNQYAIGQNSPAENEKLKRPAVFVNDRPTGFWTRALVPLMEERNATVFGAMQKAATTDAVAMAARRDPAIDAGLAQPIDTPGGQVRVLPEEVQSIARNGGDAMKMECEGCGKRYVVIWAGDTTRERDFHDVEGMIDVLRTHWPGDPADVVFKVFFGDGQHKVTGALAPPAGENRLPPEWGAVPARPAALQRYLEQDLPASLGANDQFFFYATDHGSWYARDTQQKQVAPGLPAMSAISIDTETYAAALIEIANQPSLTIDYFGLVDPASVYLNDRLLGTLPPASAGASETQPASVEFSVSDLDLLMESLVRIEPGGTPFTVTSVLLDLGSIGRDPPAGALPEPGSAALVLALTLPLFLTSFRRHRPLRPDHQRRESSGAPSAVVRVRA